MELLISRHKSTQHDAGKKVSDGEKKKFHSSRVRIKFSLNLHNTFQASVDSLATDVLHGTGKGWSCIHPPAFRIFMAFKKL